MKAGFVTKNGYLVDDQPKIFSEFLGLPKFNHSYNLFQG